MSQQRKTDNRHDQRSVPGEPSLVALLARIEAHLDAIRNAHETANHEWLTVAEVAAELRVSRATVERLIHAGHLQAATITTSQGRGSRHRFRVRRAWIDAFLESQSTPKPHAQRPRRPRYDGPDYLEGL